MVTSILPLVMKEASVVKRGQTILQRADVTFERPQFVAVMGPNGAGKTTLLRALHGLERLHSGNVAWAGTEPEARSEHTFVFQTPTLLRRSVIDNIAYPLRLRGVSRRKARKEAHEWAERCSLAHTVGRQAATLSGGERQKLSLARALITKPQALFLDEPTTNLDGQSTREIEAILRDVRASRVLIIMVTHNAAQARRLANRVIFLHEGRIIEDKPSAIFFAAPETKTARRFLSGDII